MESATTGGQDKHKHKRRHKKHGKQGFGQTKLESETTENPVSAGSPAAAAAASDLPAGWSSRTDPQTKKTYYFTTDGSGKTSWDKPTKPASESV